MKSQNKKISKNKENVQKFENVPQFWKRKNVQNNSAKQKNYLKMEKML